MQSFTFSPSSLMNSTSGTDTTEPSSTSRHHENQAEKQSPQTQKSNTSRPPQPQLWWIFVVSLLLLFAIIAGAWFWNSRLTQKQATKDGILKVIVKDQPDLTGYVQVQKNDAEKPVNFQMPLHQEQSLEPGRYQIHYQNDALGSDSRSVEIARGQKITVELTLRAGQNSQQGSAPSPQVKEKAKVLLGSGPRIERAEIFGSQLVYTLIGQDTRELRIQDLNSAGSTKIDSGCEYLGLNMRKDNAFVRYFKNCTRTKSSGKSSGFYAYDLKTKKEERILPTSEPDNIFKVFFKPNNNSLIFLRGNGEYGVVENSKVRNLGNNSSWGSIQFSPDGENLVIINSPKKAPVINNKLFNSFGVELYSTTYSELLNKKNQATLKPLGLGLMIPRNPSVDKPLIQWVDQKRFYFGDSQYLYSLDSTLNQNTITQSEPGRIFIDTQNKEYIFYNSVLTLKNDPKIVVATGVQKVFQLENKHLYYQSNNRLFRLVNDKPTQAYPEELALVSVQDKNKLLLVTQKGVVLTSL